MMREVLTQGNQGMKSLQHQVAQLQNQVREITAQLGIEKEKSAALEEANRTLTAEKLKAVKARRFPPR